MAILNYLFRGDGLISNCNDAADANDDGGLNVADAIYEFNYLFRGGSPPPLPFPAVGADPTADGLDCQGPSA